VDPQWAGSGKQEIENTGPLDTKRMQTVDEEFLDGTMKFIDRARTKEAVLRLVSTPRGCTSSPPEPA